MKQENQSKTLNSQGNTSKHVSPVYRYSRKSKTAVQSLYSDVEHITILEGPYSYWIYDEDAEKISSLFGFELYKGKKGYSLVYKKTLHHDFIEGLKAQGINYVIVHPKTIEEIIPASIMTYKGEIIKENQLFKMEDSSGSISKYIIKRAPRSKTSVINHPDNSTEIIRVPDIDELFNVRGVTVITHRSDMAALLLGKHVGDEIIYRADSY